MLKTLILLLVPIFLVAAEPTASTKRWWSHVQVMASDNMEGRDTGSEGYKKAARYVVAQFERLGLKPAGEHGWYQTVPLRSVELNPAGTSVTLVRNGSAKTLRFLEEVSITPRLGLPASIEAPLVAVKCGSEGFGADVKGAIIVCSSTASPAVATQALAAGAVGMMAIDNPRALETPRWPVAYARSVSIVGGAARGATAEGLINLRLSADLADEVLKGPALLRIKTQTETRTFDSDNIIGVLPGSDPALSQEYVVVSAHLDGYGFGTPVNGDKIYNGAFDDSAYVATLIELAAHLKEQGQPLKRSLLFAVFTGEEKGLLGSAYFTSHPTTAKEKLVADLNLDYLRPIFPLRMLTTLALDESSLGETAKKVAEPMGIRIQADLEPERGLFRRSDQFNFLRIGVPALAFIFGYEKGSEEEKIYRKWYMERYHKPADDLNQPIDFEAAGKFNQFYERLVVTVGNDAHRPEFRPGSTFLKAANR